MKIVRKILKNIPFLRSLYLFTKRVFFYDNPLFYKYKFDGIATRHNMSFIKDNDFSSLYKNASITSGVKNDFYLRIHQALWCSCLAIKIDGDFVELGTGRGLIFLAIANKLKSLNINKNIYLFDTFLPNKTDSITGEQSNNNIKSAFYANDINATKENFKIHKNVNLIQGKCPDSLKEIFPQRSSKISFIHIDLNFHEAEINSLEYLWDFILPGGVILLDDYANFGRDIQYRAFNNFFKKHNTEILSTASGQGIAIK